MTERRPKRKRIPDRVKLIAALAAMGLTIEEVEFDHDPALGIRRVNPATGDTIPPANDPKHIKMLLIADHKVKTFGPGGEKRITTAGSDIHKINKIKNLSKAQEESRRRILEKPPREERKPKTRWPRRPMGKVRKNDRQPE